MQLKTTESSFISQLMLAKRCGENARKADKMHKEQKETVQAAGEVVWCVFKKGLSWVLHPELVGAVCVQTSR